MDGIINVNKPIGITSHDVVYRLRRLLGIKKIGHTGTLDPDASGVLPMCVGKGTKLAELLTAADKQYLAELTLGAFTDTQDKSGNILEEFSVCVSAQEIECAVKSFIGEVEQIPPMYSAIKIDGKKLYELAREGKTVERSPRRITIKNIDVKNIDLDKNTVTMVVDCSKGTYIRTLCEDIGKKLGCGGYMSKLCRTKSGRFSIEKSFTLEEIEEMLKNGDNSFLIPVQDAIPEYSKIVLADNNSKKLQNGIKIFPQGLMDGEVYRVFNEQNQFLAIATWEDKEFKVLKTFYDGSASTK